MKPNSFFITPYVGSLICALAAGQALAEVTPQGWWHYGEVADYYADSSGNNRRFALGFSCAGGGNAGGGVVPFGVGGPLGTTGFSSTHSVYWTPLHCNAAAMWNPWGAGTPENEWNPPPTNYVVECWILPEDTGITTGNRTWFFASGSGDFSQPDRPQRTGAGGVYLAIDQAEGTSKVGAFVIPNAGQGVPTEVQIGDFVDMETSRWMHVAVVNDNGTNTFYVDGVARGASTSQNTIPNGNIFAGGSPGTQPSFKGYLDELRISTFEPGKFSVSDLLLRPAGPSIIEQPQSAVVWDGGAASFKVTPAVDASITYQWRSGETAINGANQAQLYFPAVTAADNGKTFSCLLTGGGVTITSAVVSLTIVTPTAEDIADAQAYRNVVRGESSLAAYFPGDNCTGSTLTNVVDSASHGTVLLNAYYDGQTNRALIQRSVAFDGNATVQLPAKEEYEFASGNGTVEALLYITHTTVDDQALFSAAVDSASYSYGILVNGAGNSLAFVSGEERLTWSVAPSLIGRLVHIAFTIKNAAEVTPFLDGAPLATQTLGMPLGFTGSPAWIGSMGDGKFLAGAVGELAVYRAALSGSAIQSHYTKLVYGTTVAPPVFVSQTMGPKTLYAGSAPVLSATVSGALPFTYQWKSNGVTVAGATSPSLTVAGGAAGTSATYILTASNVFGSADSQPITLDFVAPSGAYAQAVAADRPSSYWRLGESSGTLAKDSAGFNDAEYVNAVKLGVPGAFPADSDTAMQVAGDGARAQAPFSTTLNPSTPFSVEFLVKPALSGQQSTCVIGAQNRAIGRSGYAIYQGLNGAFWEAHLGDASTVRLWMFGKEVPQAGQWYHVVLVYDPSLENFPARLYVNGVDDLNYTDSRNEGTLLPNSEAPLEIGSRYGGGVPYNGTIDDVAFYNYALTEQQVVNHWKFTWEPAVVDQQPVDVSETEGNAVTLTVKASGYPNTYQWFKNGTALVAADNPDGTPHYPQGVTSETLVIAQATAADAGAYHVVITNPSGSQTSADARVTVANDTTPPTIALVEALSTPSPNGGKPYLVKVVFSKRMNTATAQAAANYSLNGGVTVSGVSFFENAAGAAFGADWRSVILATSGLTPGQSYTLNVTGVKDRTTTGNTIAPASVSFTAPVLTTGVIGWDYYYLGEPAPSPLDVAWLIASPFFPNGPITSALPTTFDSNPITGGDLATQPGFGALGSNYGSCMSGWITPKVSGRYTFFIASDDPSQLYLNASGTDPAGAILIAEETDCCDAFQDFGVTNDDGFTSATSEAVSLVAGRSYFIKALQTEGGGGDWVKVAWQLEGDQTPSAQLLPIGAEYLSAYAAVAEPEFDLPVMAGGQLTIRWTGGGTLYESTDLTTWTAVPGSPSSPYTVAPTGAQKFYLLRQ